MEILDKLLRHGARIPAGASIEIGPDVDINRISGEGVVIGSGCRIHGERTLILPGARLGAEGPVTVENCQIGPGVELKGGFFKDSVFLSGSSCGSGSHVREGTILEEQASIAHSVGLKQTILFPFVTLGSLINFCDCLMAGGTSRRNHSEVGSAYIHFNYTPGQDKATASLLGDVPEGVMLNRPPIFLGGQGGLVGPCRLAYGTVTAAGTIWRKDELRPGHLLFGGARREGGMPYRPGAFRTGRRIVTNNIVYIANLAALVQWYRHVRSMFVGEGFPEALLAAAIELLQGAVAERVRRLGDLLQPSPAAAAPEGGEGGGRGEIFKGGWPEAAAFLGAAPRVAGDAAVRDPFLQAADAARQQGGNDYLAAVKGFSAQTAAAGTRWLQGIVDRVVAGALERLPGFGADPGS